MNVLVVVRFNTHLISLGVLYLPFLFVYQKYHGTGMYDFGRYLEPVYVGNRGQMGNVGRQASPVYLKLSLIDNRWL